MQEFLQDISLRAVHFHTILFGEIQIHYAEVCSSAALVYATGNRSSTRKIYNKILNLRKLLATWTSETEFII